MRIVFIVVFTGTILASFFNDAAQVPNCNQIHLFGNVAPWWSDYAVIFNYSMDVSISAVDEWNTMLSFSNFAHGSADPNLYYQDKPLRYLIEQNGELNNPYIYCPTMTGTCNITIFNGGDGAFQLPVYLNGTQDSYSGPYLYTDFRFDMGSLYETAYGQLFDPNDMPCYTSYAPGGTISQQYCCTNYTYVTIPDTVTAQCTNFESNTTFLTSNGTIIASFSLRFRYSYSSNNFPFTSKKNFIFSTLQKFVPIFLYW